jgi:hypothetical protein
MKRAERRVNVKQWKRNAIKQKARRKVAGMMQAAA